ncbi:hypothetical protein JYT25_00580 [bacterium AH-315-C20]|nr:hypothetical protein [bacterium AH-315-C20]
MTQLKELHKESIPKAVERAKHYRLLNDPWQAESICRDILQVDPDNEDAILILILALTDQFGTNTHKTASTKESYELAKRLKTQYKQLYYRGLIEEHLGKAALLRDTPRVKYIAYEFYRNAMDWYTDAAEFHPEDNEESILRWNACVRAIRDFKLESAPNVIHEHPLLE